MKEVIKKEEKENEKTFPCKDNNKINESLIKKNVPIPSYRRHSIKQKRTSI